MESPTKSIDKIDHLIKLITIGDSSVGKSSIIIKYTENKFDTSTLSTIGNNYFTVHLMLYRCGSTD
jgi:Ras-related protein Rab-18